MAIKTPNGLKIPNHQKYTKVFNSEARKNIFRMQKYHLATLSFSYFVLIIAYKGKT
jgi:hypothetical protein